MMWEASLSFIQIMKLTKRINVERRLSQQMVTNDSIFVTIFNCVGKLFKLPK